MIVALDEVKELLAEVIVLDDGHVARADLKRAIEIDLAVLELLISDHDCIVILDPHNLILLHLGPPECVLL